MPKDKIYNPHCIVNYFHYQATGKLLYCQKCVFKDCECKKVKH